MKEIIISRAPTPQYRTNFEAIDWGKKRKGHDMAFAEGADACKEARKTMRLQVCPYLVDTEDFRRWHEGYKAEREEQ